VFGWQVPLKKNRTRLHSNETEQLRVSGCQLSDAQPPQAVVPRTIRRLALRTSLNKL
jgi:hypothetical protein